MYAIHFFIIFAIFKTVVLAGYLMVPSLFWDVTA
jgi:hypothetical protein